MENLSNIEGNKLIAQFLGYKYFPHNHPELKNGQEAGWKKDIRASWQSTLNKLHGLHNDAYLCRSHTGLQFHKHWGWLMMVVDKIESIREETKYGVWESYSVSIRGLACTIESNLNNPDIMPRKYEKTTYLNDKLDSTWIAVVTFIQWHNSQSK